MALGDPGALPMFLRGGTRLHWNAASCDACRRAAAYIASRSPREVIGSMSSAPWSMRTTDARLNAVRRPSANQLILRALLSIGSAALVVRALGMVSQVASTSRFGAGAEMDAYLVASGLPILVALAVAGMIESSVIPVYAQLRTQESKEQTSAVFSSLLTLCLVGTAVLTLILLVSRRQVIFLTAPALDPYRMELAVQIAPVIFPIVLLMAAISFLECILNTEG